MPFRNALQPERTNRAYDRRKLLTIPQNRFGWSSYGPWALDQPLDRPKLHELHNLFKGVTGHVSDLLIDMEFDSIDLFFAERSRAQ